MKALPTGTVTFFFSDMQGSTRLLQELGHETFSSLAEEHQRLVREALDRFNGVEIATEGDSFFAVFPSAPDAVSAAIGSQQSLAQASWPGGVEVAIRIGLHSGEGKLGGDNYVGIDVNRAARIAASGHGGQVLLSEATATLVRSKLPPGTDVKELGVHRLKDLTEPERIYQLNISGLASDFPPLKTVDARPNNLPTQLTSFVGREKELDELRRLLEDTRLLTLTGPGGTGKTRLSIQLAAEAGEDFPDGAFFVPLAPLSDPAAIPDAMVEALKLPNPRGASGSAQHRLREFLSTKKVLLVLDNFEQLVEGAELVSEMLKESPGLKVVVTTRVALRLYGESEYPVPPLGLPDLAHLPDLDTLSQYEAVALFIQRAQTVRPDFRVTNESAPSVAEICARLDGLPLAIELAAARVRALSPQALLKRLDERLKLLVGGSRDLPARQQTLRQAIAWSYDLLDSQEQSLFAHLGAFLGSFSLEELEQVVDSRETDVFEGIYSLLDKSLVRAMEGQAESRYYLLETIREFAVEQLESRPDVHHIRRNHASAYLALAEQAAPRLITAERSSWLDRLERDHDNFAVAVDWSVKNSEAELALRLVYALWRFWQMRGHLIEAERLIEAARMIPCPDELIQLQARALQAAGGVMYWQGRLDEAQKLYLEAVDLWRQIGDKKGIAEALYDSSFKPLWEEELSRTDQYLQEALRLFQEIGDLHGESKVRWGMGALSLARKELDDADAQMATALKGFTQLGDDFMILWTHNEMGVVDLARKDFKAAADHFAIAMKLSAEARDLSGILFQLENFSLLAKEQGDLERALKLRAASVGLEKASGTSLVEISQEFSGLTRVELGPDDEERLKAAWDEGESLSVDEAIAYALEAV